MHDRFNPRSAYHVGRQDGFAAGVIVTLFIAALVVGALALSGCASTNTLTIPAPPPIELEAAP